MPSILLRVWSPESVLMDHIYYVLMDAHTQWAVKCTSYCADGRMCTHTHTHIYMYIFNIWRTSEQSRTLPAMSNYLLHILVKPHRFTFSIRNIICVLRMCKLLVQRTPENIPPPHGILHFTLVVIKPMHTFGISRMANDEVRTIAAPNVSNAAVLACRLCENTACRFRASTHGMRDRWNYDKRRGLAWPRLFCTA